MRGAGRGRERDFLCRRVPLAFSSLGLSVQEEAAGFVRRLVS